MPITKGYKQLVSEAHAARRSIGRRHLSDLNHAGLALMLEPVTFSGNRQDAGVVQQMIQQRRRQHGILRKGRIPLPKGQIAGDDQRTPLVAGSGSVSASVSSRGHVDG